MDGTNRMDFSTDPTMSLLSLDSTEAPAFDYSVYLQQQEIDYLAEDSSSTSTTHPLSLSPAAIQQAFTPPQPFGIVPAPTSLPSSTPGGRGTAVVLHQQSHGSSNNASQSPPNHTQTNTKPTAKQRLERRGHTKSRRGCFNCKRRRIKCQETKPSCGHCLKTGLECTYPPAPSSYSPPFSSYSSSSSSSLIHQPQQQQPTFTLLDLRLFHHFLSTCYPHHPIGSEPLWTHEVPCLSQSHPYLMHAILGYAASSLSDSTVSSDSNELKASLLTSAMSHRLKAIKAIKKCLSESGGSPNNSNNSSSIKNNENNNSNNNNNKVKVKKCGGEGGGKGGGKGLLSEEGNALMATCFALTYQSVLLDDGMVEYMTFIRGIVIVAIQMYVAAGGGDLTRSKMLFGELLGEQESQRRLEPHMKEVGLVRREWVDAAVDGIDGLEALVLQVQVMLGPEEEESVEREYWKFLSKMAGSLYVSSWKAYLAMTEHYGWWMMLSHEKFQRLIAVPESQVAVLLATHWIALKQIMAVITETEEKAAAMPCPGKAGNDISLGIIRWLKYLNGLVDEEHLAYNRWPMWVEAQLDVDRGFFGKTH
ncbi:C6 zinc finger protein [Cladorrhinum sp. PSN332]|nr:C6 zinc finger protein [Cladorrhinum sp. PSN332]